MSSWKEVAKAVDFAKTDRILISLTDLKEVTEIVVFKVDGRYFAIEGSCPHRGAPWLDGTRLGTTLTCPWHLAEINLTTGAALKGPLARGVTTYPVREIDGRIEIEA